MKQIFAILLFSICCSYSYGEDEPLLDIKTFCRMPAEEAKLKLPVSFSHFYVESRDTDYGHEETWTLDKSELLKPLGLKSLVIEIHQGIVQMVWLIDLDAENDIGNKNLVRAGLKNGELTKVMSEFRVNGRKGIIRILGDDYGYFQCFEYHGGH